MEMNNKKSQLEICGIITRKDIIRSTEWIYSPERSEMVADAFMNELSGSYYDNWGDIKKVAESNKYFTIGLYGGQEQLWDSSLNIYFPCMLLTNYSDRKSCKSNQSNMLITAFDVNSKLTSTLEEISKIELIEGRTNEGDKGIIIHYKTLKNYDPSTKVTEPKMIKRIVSLTGHVQSGFVIFKDDKKVLSLNDASKSIRQE